MRNRTEIETKIAELQQTVDKIQEMNETVGKIPATVLNARSAMCQTNNAQIGVLRWVLNGGDDCGFECGLNV